MMSRINEDGTCRKEHAFRMSLLHGVKLCMYCGMEEAVYLRKRKLERDAAKAAEDSVPVQSTRARADEVRAARIMGCGLRESGHRMIIEYGRRVCADCGATPLDLPPPGGSDGPGTVEVGN